MEYFLYGFSGSWVYWILLIALFIYAKNTRRMVRELTIHSKAPEPTVVPIMPATPTEREGVVPMPNVSDADGRLSLWLQENWLIKVGALLIILAVSWFVNYAFVHNWIGPIGRITLGLCFGAVLMGIGAWRMRSFITQGGIFLVLGSSTILLTTFAARTVYNFFTPESALALMFASVVVVAFISVMYRREQLALASLFLAYVTPLMTYSGTLPDVSLFIYLLIIALGCIWVTVITGWKYLTPTAIVLTGLYSLPYIIGDGGDARYTLLMFAYGFAALFFVTGTFSAIHATALSVKEKLYDVYTPLLNGIFLLGWVLGVVPAVWQSLTLSAWMTVFVLASFLIFKKTGERNTFYAYAAVGITYLAAATAAELSGNALTIAYTIEVGALVCLARLALNNLEVTEILSYLFFVPGLMSLPALVSSSWTVGPINADFFVLIIVSLTMAITGLVLKSGYFSEGRGNSPIGKALIIIATVYGYMLIWLMLHANILPDGLATGVALALYTICGIAVYLYGQNNSRKDLTTYGGILIGVVILRLLLIDVWSLELVWRIVVFAGVGALLMSTAFIGRSKK